MNPQTLFAKDQDWPSNQHNIVIRDTPTQKSISTSTLSKSILSKTTIGSCALYLYLISQINPIQKYPKAATECPNSFIVHNNNALLNLLQYWIFLFHILWQCYSFAFGSACPTTPLAIRSSTSPSVNPSSSSTSLVWCVQVKKPCPMYKYRKSTFGVQKSKHL